MFPKKYCNIAMVTLLLLASLLTSCATPTEAPEPTQPEEPEPTEITLTEEPEPTEITPTEEIELTFWYLASTEEATRLIENMVSLFQENHPGVIIEMSTYGYEDFKNATRLAFSGGIGPDVAYGQPGPQGHLAFGAAGYLVDLTNAVEEYGWDQTQSNAAINYWREPGKPLYGVSFDHTAVGVFYNTEIFDELELEPPENWEDLENILTTLKNAGHAPFSCGAVDSWTLGHYFMALAHVSVPFDNIVKIFRMEEGATYLDEGFIQAATILQDWVDKGYFNEGFEGMVYGDQNDMFITGQTAMNLGGTWNNQTFIKQPDFEVGFFLLPRVNPDLDWHAILSTNNVWYVSSYSENKDMAIELVDFMLGKEVALAKWNAGDIPAYMFETLPDPIAKLQLDVYEWTTKPELGLGHYYNEAPELMTEEFATIQALVVGELTPEAAMAHLDELLQRLLAEEQ